MAQRMRPGIKRALLSTFIARTAANAGLRVVYPFFPEIARGLGVTPAALASVVALRNLGGFATPAVARISEKKGRRWMMVAAMIAVTAGVALTAGSELFVVAGAGIVIVGFAKPAFDVSMQAWFGDRVPYGERGRVFGITELTWAVALLVTVPASGFLIQATDWRAPFVIVTVMAGVGTIAVSRMIERDRPHEHVERKLVITPERARVLGAVLLFILASEIIFVVYGQWLEDAFGLSVAGIGTFTLVVVVAEFAGEGLVAAVADRWGLRRMFLAGLLVSGVAYLGLAATGTMLLVAVVVVAVWIAAFEVTIVAAIPFISEMAVDSRDRMLSWLAIMISSGRAIGALLGQPLFSAGGIRLSGVVAALCVAVAAVLLLGVTEHEPAGAPVAF
jgi:MFS transporter, DHA1 family, inner membrane transport protein